MSFTKTSEPVSALSKMDLPEFCSRRWKPAASYYAAHAVEYRAVAAPTPVRGEIVAILSLHSAPSVFQLCFTFTAAAMPMPT